MSMFGKMSVGVRRITSGPMISISSDSTTNVYGRRSASLTIHIDFACPSVFSVSAGYWNINASIR